MLTINLSNLHFNACHGVYAEETVIGGSYTIDLSVNYIPLSIPVTELSETINYVDLYKLLQLYMQQPTPLLETLVTQIAAAILNRFTRAEEVIITIYKNHPPITQFQGRVGVSFTLKKH